MFKIKKEGYFKIHVAVDIKTKEILALEVTDEKLHDSKMLKKLVNHVLKTVLDDKNKVKNLKLVLADGAHDTNTNFGYLEKNGITPGIKVRKNSIISPKNNKLRNREVSKVTNKGFVEMEDKKKVWTEMDGWLKQPFRLSRECLVSTHQSPDFKT